MDEILKLFSGLNQNDKGNFLELLPLLTKLMGEKEQKKDVALSTSELSKILYETWGEGQLNNSTALKN